MIMYYLFFSMNYSSEDKKISKDLISEKYNEKPD